MRQAHPDRAEDEAICADADVVLVENLRHRVVAADVQHDVIGPNALRVDELVIRSTGSRRDLALDDEDAIRGQVAGGVLEAANLVVLRQQIADRVVDQVDQPVGAPGTDARHVTHGDLDRVPVRLLAHPVNHVCRQLDAVDAHPGGPERQRDAASAHRELERVALAGEPGEKCDGLVLVASRLGVVALRHVKAEARSGVEALHGHPSGPAARRAARA